MAVCKYCKKEMRDESVVTCEGNRGVKIDGKEYKPNTSNFDNEKRCHDCNIVNQEGNAHHVGCDMEQCQKCGDQLITCDCESQML